MFTELLVAETSTQACELCGDKHDEFILDRASDKHLIVYCPVNNQVMTYPVHLGRGN